MKTTAKLSTALLLVFALLTPLAAPAAAQAQAVDYVAFGDSVAAGVRGGTGEASSAAGYTDLLAADLKAASLGGSFSEDFCVSGATTSTLLSDTAVLKDSSSAKTKAVASAELATVQIGANDMMAPFTGYVKSAGGAANMDITKAKAALQQVADSVDTTAPAVQANIEAILKNILAVNPNVKIFVLGYYNPLPAVSAYLGVDLNTSMTKFNGYIAKAVSDVDTSVSGAQVVYVDVMAGMAADPAANLVTTDIHPTEAGYKTIAATLWARVKVFLPTADESSDIPVSVAPTSANVLVNGTKTAFEAYNIDGNNYFKLRDLAYAMSGSTKQFNVWAEGEGSALTVMLKSETAYVPVGGEMSVSGAASANALRRVPKVSLAGQSVTLTTYNIGGYNYVKLRDVGAALDFGVGWDNASATIAIDASAHYTADK